MKIAEAGFSILERTERRGNLAVIEQAARTCYKSEDKIKPDGSSAVAIVNSLIRNHHEAMLEHGDYMFQVQPTVYEELCRSLQCIRNMGYAAPMLEMSCNAGKPIISGNIRAWRELFRHGTASGPRFIGYFDPVYTQDCEDRDCIPNAAVRRIHYEDLRDVFDKETHIRQTVKFIIDRGISHEFVRHRRFSFAQESTRYCNYQKNKFGCEITFIAPFYLDPAKEPYIEWKKSCYVAEKQYFRLLEEGLPPQEARAVLPTSTKTELVMTGTLREWKHFFNLRALGTTGEPHPQAKEVALPLLEMFRVGWPDVFPTPAAENPEEGTVES